MGLNRLIYCSRAIEPTKTMIDEILTASRTNNPKSHVTGMLLYTSDYFMQLIEGSRANINGLFQKISRDQRHKDVEVLAFGAIEFRLFDRWSMNYVAQSNPNLTHLRRFSVRDDFDPYELSATAAEQLCLDFSLRAHNEMFKAA